MGRTAYDYEEHGVKNIPIYIRNFELPPPDHHDWFLARNLATDVNKSHQNTLRCQHEKWRYLEHIKQIKFDEIPFTKWASSAFPKNPINIVKGSQYKLPSVLPRMYSHAPIDIENMVPWLSLLLITSHLILKSTKPAMEPFAFQPGNKTEDPDKHLFQYKIWSHSGTKPHEPKRDSGSVLVAYQPPYILTISDLKEFVSCKSFPSFDSFGKTLPSKYRLWAKLWDSCQTTKCNWFILTSYTHWVLGAFSKGMRAAFISPVISYNNKQPTILEYVLFWLCSANRLPGTFRLPQVDEPVFAEMDIDMLPVAHTRPRPPDSQSFWSGRDATPECSAHVELVSEFSQASSWEIPERSQSSTTKGGIQQWLATCQHAQHRLLDENDILSRNLPEQELMDIMPELLQGEWMIPS